MYLFATLFLLLTTVFLYLYWFFKKSFEFFDQCGIPWDKDHSFFGSMKDVLLKRKTFLDLYLERYERLKSYKFVGIYNLHQPQIMINDPDLVKTILVKDFAHFHDRGFTIHKEIEPLANNLANLPGEEWKNLRIKLTSTFTSGKMKMMFPLLKKCSYDMNPVLTKYFSDDETFDVKDFCARYTTDVIGTCAFGIDTHSLQNPESEFRKMGRTVFQTRWKPLVRIFFPSLSAKYIKLFGLYLFPQEINDYFINTVKDMVKYREENNITRGDFLDLLIAMKNHKELEKLKDQHEDADLEKFMSQIGEKCVKNDVEMTPELIAAQCFLFFIGGFEGASNALMFLLFELTQHPDIQNKLREEILSTLESNNGEMTYEMMRKLPYLEMVIAETLRKYPLGPILLRLCTENYKIPDSEVVIKKGTSIVIPLMGFNADSKYYERPDDFYPEHFTKEAISKRPHYAYLPFGEGPRVCIERFARMQIIVGAVHLLKDFAFELSPKTTLPLQVTPSAAGLAVKGGVWMKCRPWQS
ncbi:probable cytochrome P450 6a20 isoform X2 [Planococcus citri]|uniref:probable cytochrome P450 6a20 isoform X2 n=1 Tax=Planococcus citri TaxID=170843 RepID=UPI0031F8A29D